MSVYIYVVLLAGVFVAGLAFYFLDDVVLGVYDIVSTTWPAYFTGAEWTFALRTWNWVPILVILIPLLLWVISNSIREAEGAKI